LEIMRDAGDTESERILQRFARERPGMPTHKRALGAYQPAERHVLVDDIEGVKVITLRRPEALNALHDEMTDEILAVIRRFEGDAKVVGFVIVGFGTKAFCAGADIGRFPSLLGDAGAAAQYARDCSRLLVHLDSCTKPVVAALNGMALGGGFELAMRCHALVAERGAWMQLPEVTLGILPGIGAMVVPYRRWPAAAATFHRMLTRAERLSAEQAQKLGVIDALADGYDDLIAKAIAAVRAMKGVPPRIADGAVSIPAFDAVGANEGGARKLSESVIRLIETAVAQAAAAPKLDAALEVGYRAFGAVACSAAAREGIDAFMTRRKPDFGATG
nr:enoyl-CoA hydratase/isomerase family protein [Piscinibacter sp.]